ncbi:hypothetical protein CONPUDRAFT_140654 [Coniophora puteana RWD-64-598 SS2]|uniref:G-protein coupled receptors family 1 profile domain-containing protein n=1 Tax=Coniophora puteana (strain RWD-64-598) TaxID=741705 RepID=R7SDW4_CONPW|nr:uncharacterized protein CONPUDRAFT_140654 [Coniophora puteana RWD-64-598 SS2]EIW74060.1 hypothetical protein CONPUDRAFT_140654 [Coniophora puteana RWD-64-598 SS2]
MNNLILRTAVFLVLNVMMSMRIYALYGGSKCVLFLLGSCVTTVQASNIVLTFMAMLPLNVSVVRTPTEGAWCSYAVSNRQAWYQTTAFILLVAYDSLLLVLSVASFIRRLQEQRQGLAGMVDTFMGLIVRDNVLYFILAFSGLTLSACSLFTVANRSLPFNIGFNTIAADLGAGLQLTILGPLMMLSVLEYDALRERGGTSYYTGTATLEFAAVYSPDDCEDDPSKLA